MIKKFFVAMILGLLVMSSQIVSAANIDWSKAKRISSKAEFARYIDIERRKGHNTFYVVLTNGLRIDDKWEFSKLVPSNYQDCSEPKVVNTDGKNTKMIYAIREYPGTRVANAYLSRQQDIAWKNLNYEERLLYSEALKIVNEANKRSSQIAKERYIHDEICKRVDFYHGGDMRNQPRFVTAIGAIIDGKANCQGYTDAFYMLCNMCGLKVGRITGKNGDIEHQWNTITFDDGKTYCVDVSYADKITAFKDVITYTHFNAPLEIMKITHSAQWDIMTLNLQQKIDNRYSFSSLDGLAYTSTVEEGLKLIGKKFTSENYKIFRVMTPFEQRFSEWSTVRNYLRKVYSKEIKLNTLRLGNYFFITVIKQ